MKYPSLGPPGTVCRKFVSHMINHTQEGLYMGGNLGTKLKSSGAI